jgi:hypothetical protein
MRRMSPQQNLRRSLLKRHTTSICVSEYRAGEDRMTCGSSRTTIESRARYGAFTQTQTPFRHALIGGAKRFIECKLHLGTAELYSGRDPLGRFLAPKQFDRLIEMIRPKFPRLILPLPEITA